MFIHCLFEEQVMKKAFILALGTLVLTGCGEKDAEYYYNHPDEIKTVMANCEGKIANTADDALATLKDDKTCKAATLAAAGIEMGDLKKAVLKEDKMGWGAYIQSLIDGKQKLKEDFALLEQIEKMPDDEAEDALLKNFFRCPVVGLRNKAKPHEKELCERVDVLYTRGDFKTLDKIDEILKKKNVYMLEDISSDVFKLSSSCNNKNSASKKKICDRVENIQKEIKDLKEAEAAKQRKN